MEYRWLLFCPQLPATPSSPRVTIWRKMRSAGCLGLDNGLWLMPHNPEMETFVEEMKQYVNAQNGTSRIFVASALDGDTESEILQRFRQDRAEEYAEIKEQCADFLQGIQKEIQRQNFSFAEYEENEQDFNKLETWFDKVRQRDFLGGEQAEEAQRWLEKCREALQQFADESFIHEDMDHGSKMKYDPGPPEHHTLFKAQDNPNNDTNA